MAMPEDVLLELRARARARLASDGPAGGRAGADEALAELAIHKAELEMQNEALRESQGALEASRRNFGELFLFAPVSYLVLDGAGRVEDANLAAGELLGHPRTDLKGRRFSLFLAPSRGRAVQEALDRVLSTGEPFREEVALRGAAGEETWVLLKAQLLARSGADKACLVAAWDVTAQRQAAAEVERQRARLEVTVADRTAELRRANEELRAEHRRLEAILDGTGAGTWEWNVQTGETVFDERWAGIAGYSLAELAPVDIGTWTRLAHPDDLAASGEALRRHFAGETPRYDVECRMRHKDGRWVTVLDRGMVVSRGADGTPLLMLGTHTDVTEQVEARRAVERLAAELEERVHERTSALEQALAEMEAFSYSVAHDLRAPIRAIDGFSALLARGHGERLGGEALRLLDAVRGNSRKMGLLIDSLLDFSRLGRMGMERVRVDVARLAREVVDELLPAPERSRVELRLGELPPAIGDPALVRVVLQNLLSNALKFSGKREAAQVEVGFGDGPGGPAYFVRDNGAGFDMKYADKLFGVFQRLHGAAAFPGTGIGLALVRRIVERHGGRAWAEGEVDRGATFRFTLGG